MPQWIKDLKINKKWILLTPYLIVILGVLLAPRIFYDRFIWKYFYGPILADSQALNTIVYNGIEAHPGYTLVSEISYAYTLLTILIFLIHLLRIFDIGKKPQFFHSLTPFILFGGAIRVIEDAELLELPLSLFFISPIIYFTIFIYTTISLFICLYLEKKDYIENYTKLLSIIGIISFATILIILLSNGFTLWIPLAIVGLATLAWAITWYLPVMFIPKIKEATGKMGMILLWGHQVDAASTVIGLEYLGYGEKHPIVRYIIETSGTTYSFMLAKAIIVLLILYSFDKKFLENSTRLAYLLLIGILAIGLGPGTRDLIRATIGV